MTSLRSSSCAVGILVMAVISLQWLIVAVLHPAQVVAFALAMVPVAFSLLAPANVAD